MVRSLRVSLVLREAAGRDVLCRSSRGDCVGQEGQEEPAAFQVLLHTYWSVDQELVGSIKCFHQGCSYTDPQSSRKSEVLNTRLSCALHWSQGIKKSVMFRLSILKSLKDDFRLE